MFVQSREAMGINNIWLVRVLMNAYQKAHACEGCGSRMLVTSASGLCPVCATRKRARKASSKRQAA